jgi:myo-inositol-1(or 4)-monophosphatase
MVNPESLLPTALEAVGIANELIRSLRPGTLTLKGERDVATEVDFTVERRIRSFLAERTPSVGFLGEEEGGAALATSELVWALDPVDGTVNFVHGIPLSGVSLSLISGDQPVLGVVDLPFLGARYWATQGGGAYLDGRRLQVSTAAALPEAIVALGDFAVGPGSDDENRFRLQVAARLAGSVLRVRMLGSAAIDLAWLAEGKVDASITLCNLPWDMAAGVVVAREAGAHVVDIDGSGYRMGSRAVLAGAPALVDRIVEVVREAERRPRAQI